MSSQFARPEACDWWISGTHVKRYKLARNKRAEEDPDYANMILQIGDGTFDQRTDSPQAAITIPERFLLHPNDNLTQLIEWTYPELEQKTDDADLESSHTVASLLPPTTLPPTSTSLSWKRNSALAENS